jgi:hypothetical protein
MAAGRSNVSCLLITNPSEVRGVEARGVTRTHLQSARASRVLPAKALSDARLRFSGFYRYVSVLSAARAR